MQAKKELIAAILAAMLSAHAAAQDNCIRGEPTPVFPVAAPGTHSFEMRSPTEAVETMRLPSGSTLKIVHGGCEYFVVSYEFPAPAGVSARNSYSAAANMLDSLRPLRPDSSFDLRRAAQALRTMARRGTALGKEKYVAGDGVDFLQARLKLEYAGGSLRLSLFRGPL